MKGFHIWPVICLILLTLAGCASMQNGEHEGLPNVASIFDRGSHDESELLLYARYFSDLPAEKQKKEYGLVMQYLNRDKQDTFNRLKAAVILAVPGSRYCDNGRALGLLNDLQRDKSHTEGMLAMIALMREFVVARQGLEENAAKFAQKAKDEQSRADGLQKKLDELKNIERTILDRKPATKK